MKEEYLRTDEATDVVCSLWHCLQCLQRTKYDPLEWKWAILSLHSAVQGAMVCHLTGGLDYGALAPESFRKVLAWYEHGQRTGRRPEKRLASPKDLFRRLYAESKRLEQHAGAVLSIPDRHRGSFDRLHRFRTDFAHFTPKGWSIELSGMPRLFLDIVEILDQIADDPWPFRHSDDKERERLRELLDDLEAELLRKEHAVARTTKPRAKKKAAPAKAKAKPAGIDEKSLNKGQLRKLGALRKSLGNDIADKAFAEWMRKGSVPAQQIDKNAKLIAETVRELVLSGELSIPRGGYLLRRGRGRVIVERGGGIDSSG